MGYPLRFFLRIKVQNQETTKDIKGPLVIVANHSSWLDPFLIGLAMPWQSHLFPIYYAMWYIYYRIPLIFPFVFLLGAFPVKKKRPLGEILKYPLDVLKNGGVVVIFPQGQRQQLGRRKKPRRGAAYLAISTNSQILPVYIKNAAGINPFNFFFRRKKVAIKIGKPFALPATLDPENLESLNEASELVALQIQNLSLGKENAPTPTASLSNQQIHV